MLGAIDMTTEITKLSLSFKDNLKSIADAGSQNNQNNHYDKLNDTLDTMIYASHTTWEEICVFNRVSYDNVIGGYYDTRLYFYVRDWTPLAEASLYQNQSITDAILKHDFCRDHQTDLLTRTYKALGDMASEISGICILLQGNQYALNNYDIQLYSNLIQPKTNTDNPARQALVLLHYKAVENGIIVPYRFNEGDKTIYVDYLIDQINKVDTVEDLCALYQSHIERECRLTTSLLSCFFPSLDSNAIRLLQVMHNKAQDIIQNPTQKDQKNEACNTLLGLSCFSQNYPDRPEFKSMRQIVEMIRKNSNSSQSAAQKTEQEHYLDKVKTQESNDIPEAQVVYDAVSVETDSASIVAGLCSLLSSIPSALYWVLNELQNFFSQIGNCFSTQNNASVFGSK